jgi:hypothetical protein
MFKTPRTQASMHWLLAALILALSSGCASPIEVKNASKAQIDLIAALDQTVADLQKSFDQFHRDMEGRIQEEGRIFVARQAIATLYPQNRPMKQITAEALFESHNTHVQPWIDNALILPDVDDQIVLLTKRIEGTSDPALKGRYALALQDLQELRARLVQNKPKAVSEIEEVILADLANERQTAQEVHQLLNVLRTQFAVMKSIATKVDAWLAIDVNITQEQADSLRDAWVSARKAIGGTAQ